MKKRGSRSCARWMLTLCGILCLTFSLFLPSAYADTYLGDLCVQFVTTENEDGPASLGTTLSTMALTYVGGSYFAVYAIREPEVAGDGPVVSSGTAILRGSQLLMTYSNTQDLVSPTRDNISTVRLNLDLSTLTGSYWRVGQTYKKSTKQFIPFYRAGSASLIACP